MGTLRVFLFSERDAACPDIRHAFQKNQTKKFSGPHAFYDFNVWNQTKFVENLQYMHMNRVRRKLVAHPNDWPWSSFLFYARRDSGLVGIDPMS